MRVRVKVKVRVRVTVGWDDKRRQDKASQNIPKRGRRRLDKSIQD